MIDLRKLNIMPTKKQLYDNWLAEKQLGITPDSFYGDEHFSAEEAAVRRAEANNAMRRARENPRGKKLGHYVSEDGKLKFVPNRNADE